jgi:SHS family lactate transporter-like MFS transporter
LTYQLGNAISSPSAQIINALAENMSIAGPKGKRVPSYGPVMAVATAIIALGIMATIAVGPEKRGREFKNVVAGQAILKPKDIETGDAASTEGKNIESEMQVEVQDKEAR